MNPGRSSVDYEASAAAVFLLSCIETDALPTVISCWVQSNTYSIAINVEVMIRKPVRDVKGLRSLTEQLTLQEPLDMKVKIQASWALAYPLCTELTQWSLTTSMGDIMASRMAAPVTSKDQRAACLKMPHSIVQARSANANCCFQLQKNQGGTVPLPCIHLYLRINSMPYWLIFNSILLSKCILCNCYVSSDKRITLQISLYGTLLTSRCMQM